MNESNKAPEPDSPSGAHAAWAARVEATADVVSALGESVVVDHRVESGHTLKADYDCIKERVGLHPCLDVDEVIVGGRDRLGFLQGLLTQDVAGLETGDGVYAGLLTVKGKMQTDMRIAARSDDLLVQLPAGNGTHLVETLDKYLFRDKVQLNDASGARVATLVIGPRAPAALATLDLESPSPPHGWSAGRVAGAAVDLVAYDGAGRAQPAVLVSCELSDYSDVLPALHDAVRASDGAVVGHGALEQVRIEAGVPRFGVDIDTSTIPLEAPLEHMISFDKGCYLGQEIIARVDARGAVNKHLVGFVLHDVDPAAPPAAGTGLVAPEGTSKAGRTIGRLTSVGTSPSSGRVLALGLVRRGFESPGTRVELDTPTDASAEVSELPFEEDGR